MASDNLFKVLNKNGHLDKYLVSIAMDIGSETAKWRCGFLKYIQIWQLRHILSL